MADKKSKDVRRTGTGISIENSIALGNTKVYDNVLDAHNAARAQNSYHYAVYVNGRTNGEYAVPK